MRRFKRRHTKSVTVPWSGCDDADAGLARHRCEPASNAPLVFLQTCSLGCVDREEGSEDVIEQQELLEDAECQSTLKLCCLQARQVDLILRTVGTRLVSLFAAAP